MREQLYIVRFRGYALSTGNIYLSEDHYPGRFGNILEAMEMLKAEDRELKYPLFSYEYWIEPI